jgi:hypothetical protein
LDEIEDDRDLEVQDVDSDVTDIGEKVDGVVDALESSGIVSAGRIKNLIEGKLQP